MKSILLISNNKEHITQIKKICEGLMYDLTISDNVTDFIFALENEDYHTLLIDGIPENEDLKLIQISKKIRPRIPIIFITENHQKEKLQKIYNEGVFYLCPAPLNVNIFIEVLRASIVYKIKQDSLNTITSK